MGTSFPPISQYIVIHKDKNKIGDKGCEFLLQAEAIHLKVLELSKWFFKSGYCEIGD